MQMKELNKRDMNILIELYIDFKKDFVDMITIEEFMQQYCRRCDNCNDIICILKGCDECKSTKEFDYELEYFDRNKEHYVYGIN